MLKDTLPENNAQPEKQSLFLKNGNAARDVLVDSRMRYRARGQKKENPVALNVNQFAGFVTVPAEKKIILYDNRLLKKIKRKYSHLTRVYFCMFKRVHVFFFFFFFFTR